MRLVAVNAQADLLLQLAESSVCPDVRRKLDAKALLQLSCDHRQTENRLFHVRDVTFGEDASRVRTGAAPEVMADLRNATLTIIRRTGEKPRAARQAYAARPKAAIRAVMRS